MRADLLIRNAGQLLTLAGPGGFGKTRLTIRLGEMALEEEGLFPDGVFFVTLEGLESADLAVPSIATALQFTFYEQSEQETQLLNYPAGKQLLLVLDSAEHLPALDELVEAILVRAPQVKIVVTSREALNLQQEWFHPIDWRGPPPPFTRRAALDENRPTLTRRHRRRRGAQR